MRPMLGAILLLAATLLLRAEDWTTVDGRTFKNVKVVSNDDGYVTILDDDGGSKLMLTELPPALRARFQFDPVKASACVAAEMTAEEKAQADEKAAEASAAQAAATRFGTPAAAPVTQAASPVPASKLPLPGGNLLENGDFSHGDSGWEGDGVSNLGGQGLLVKLSPDSWTRIYRQYQGDSGTIPSLVMIYRLSAGFAPSKDPALYTGISKKLGVEGFDTFESLGIQPGQFYGTVGDPTSNRIVCEVFNPDLHSTEAQIYRHTYPFYAAGRTDTVIVAFPPGSGTVQVLGVSVTDK